MTARNNDKDFVVFDHVQKSYDGEVLVVKDLNLNIAKGEFLTLLGPSGSGKTTCLMMLAGFETATNGDIRLDGKPINWETATGHDHIWLENNSRVKNKKFRVVVPHDLNIGSFSTEQIAIEARDLFFELTAQGICEQEVKKIVLQRFEEYFPKSYYSKDSAIGYNFSDEAEVEMKKDR